MPNGRGRGSGGRGRGLGAVGNCVCVKCGYSAPKIAGVPCMEKKCPKCGTILFREDGVHYKDAKKIKNKEV